MTSRRVATAELVKPPARNDLSVEGQLAAATLSSVGSALGLSPSCSALCDDAADVLFERGKFIVAV